VEGFNDKAEPVHTVAACIRYFIPARDKASLNLLCLSVHLLANGDRLGHEYLECIHGSHQALSRIIEGVPSFLGHDEGFHFNPPTADSLQAGLVGLNER